MPGSETPVLGSLFNKDASLTALTHLTVLETERSSLWRCSVGEGVLRNLLRNFQEYPFYRTPLDDCFFRKRL